jgi:hypothetical protein
MPEVGPEHESTVGNALEASERAIAGAWEHLGNCLARVYLRQTSLNAFQLAYVLTFALSTNPSGRSQFRRVPTHDLSQITKRSLFLSP